MIKAVAKTISVVFHPLLLPSMGMALLMLTVPHLFGQFELKQKIALIVIMAWFTFAVPFFAILMMRGMKMIDSLQMRERKERIVPFITIGTWYLITYLMYKSNYGGLFPSEGMITSMLLGVLFMLVACFVINVVWLKISLHAVGFGAAFAGMLALFKFTGQGIEPFLTLTIILGGLIGASRLIVNAHTEREVYLGYFVGFTAQFIAFSI